MHGRTRVLEQGNPPYLLIRDADCVSVKSTTLTYTQAVKKHLPMLEPYLSDTATPLHYTAASVKKDFPDAVTVFLGPCMAKRHEGWNNPSVDYVLTFEEVGAMFVAAGIDVGECSSATLNAGVSGKARGFAVSGGVADAVQATCTHENVIPVMVNGLDRKSMKLLKRYADTATCPGNLIEVMACEGGCIGGAGAIGHPRVSGRAVADWCARAHQDSHERMDTCTEERC